MSRTLFPQARQADLVVQAAADENLVFDRRTEKAYVLNPTAAAVWHAANGQRTIQYISAYLSQDTPTNEQTVSYALGQLKDLLEEPVLLPPEVATLSRRKFLAMSGVVAAGVAIPVVVTMVAPAPVHAQSATLCCVCINVAGSTDQASCTACSAYCQGLGSPGFASCTCNL